MNNEILIKKEITSIVPGFKAINKIEAVGKINEKINTELFDKLKDELSPLVRQKPNRRLLGVFALHLGVYNMFNGGKERKFKTWMKNTIGEAPVIFDSLLSVRTRSQFELYLNSKGFFDAEVSSTFSLKKKKANVQFYVTPHQVYTIGKIEYLIKDEGLKALEPTLRNNSLLKLNSNYDADEFTSERERISIELKNLGYYFFSKEHVHYDVDSSLGTHQVNVFVSIYRVNEIVGDTLSNIRDHRKFFLDQVSVRSDYNPLWVSDTTRLNSVTYKGLKSVYAGKKPKLKSQTLHRVIFLESGALYQLRNQELTYIQLGDLGTMKFTAINFSESSKDSAGFGFLNAHIQLTQAYRHGFIAALEGTNTGGNLGIGGNVAYRNKNLFRGAENLELKFSGGFEAQRTENSEESSNTIEPLSIFNTIEVSPEATISIPKFIVPWRPHVGIYTRPKTNFNWAYNFQQRPGYSRTIAKTSLSYLWNESRTKRWVVTPIDLSLVEINNISTQFQTFLDTTSKTIKYAYENHLIPAMRVSYIISTQDINRLNSFWYLKINFETAGNLFWLTNQFVNMARNDESDVSYVLKYKNIDYSQYIRPDMEIKYYSILNAHNKIVFRLAGGIGIPYENTTVMPFDKTFYGGGANDMRAWAIRSIGPGSAANSTSRFEQSGDIKMIGNIEYRYDLIKFLEGALFIDAGNVWMRKDTVRAGAEFETKNLAFVKEIGIGVGAGLRLNFSFFVFRVDYSVQMRSPSEPENARWVVTNTRFRELISNKYSRWQFGIGYPF